jgi:hypothetical protein
MAAAPTVGVVGMRALSRDIQKMTADRGPLNTAMKAAGREAAEPVAAVTRSTLPQVSGRLAGDVRVGATRTGASVRMGRASVRYAGWIEFGGTRKAPHTSTRDYSPRGRYLFPAAVQTASLSAGLYSRAVTTAFNNYRWSNETTNPEAIRD